MKNLFIIIFFSSYIHQSQGQEAEIIYWNRTETDTTNIDSYPVQVQEVLRENAKGEFYKLAIRDGKSIYKPFVLKEDDFEESTSIDSDGNMKIVTTKRNRYSETIYTDKINKLRQSKMSIFGKVHLIKEKLTDTKFEILDQFKMIGDFNCQLATTEFYGMPIEVWFASSIPLNYGPNILHNLPGLILEVKMGNKIISVTNIKYDSSSTIEPPIEGVEITREDYDKLIIEKLKFFDGDSQHSTEDIKTTIIKY